MLGVRIDQLTQEEALQKASSFLSSSNSHMIFTPNAEFLVQANKDRVFRDILNKADLSIADSTGVFLASCLTKNKLPQRIPGVDFAEKLCGLAAEKKNPVFLYGGYNQVAEKTALNLKNKYPDLKVKVLKEGQKASGLLLVALGAPKQEEWIVENLPSMPEVRIAMGVGGTFDFLSGQVKRAPSFLRKYGFEWLWRLVLQPWRLVRVTRATLIFPYLFLKNYKHE